MDTHSASSLEEFDGFMTQYIESLHEQIRGLKHHISTLEATHPYINGNAETQEHQYAEPDTTAPPIVDAIKHSFELFISNRLHFTDHKMDRIHMKQLYIMYKASIYYSNLTTPQMNQLKRYKAFICLVDGSSIGIYHCKINDVHLMGHHTIV